MRQRAAAILIIILVAGLQSPLADAATTLSSPYSAADTSENTTPDQPVVPFAQATATAVASSGLMAARTMTKSLIPVGYVIHAGGPEQPHLGLGGNWAEAWGEIIQSIEVGPGERVVDTVFSSVYGSYSTQNPESLLTPIPSLSGMDSEVVGAFAVSQLHSVVTYYPCPRATCEQSFSQRIVVDIPNGSPSGTLTLVSSRFNAFASVGTIQIRAAVVAESFSKGKDASGAAYGRGILESIVVH